MARTGRCRSPGRILGASALERCASGDPFDPAFGLPRPVVGPVADAFVDTGRDQCLDIVLGGVHAAAVLDQQDIAVPPAVRVGEAQPEHTDDERRDERLASLQVCRCTPLLWGARPLACGTAALAARQ